MVRISTASEDGEHVVLNVEGRIVGDWVPELNRTCRKFLARQKTISLDFSGVRFIDRYGIDILKKMQSEGITITGASRLIQALLGEGL